MVGGKGRDMSPAELQVVGRVRAELERLYGDRLQRLILYGSRARGDARDDSDYDLLAVLDSVPDYWAEVRKLGDLTFELMLRDKIAVHVRPVTAAQLGERTLFMHDVRADGVPV